LMMVLVVPGVVAALVLDSAPLDSSLVVGGSNFGGNGLANCRAGCKVVIKTDLCTW